MDTEKDGCVLRPAAAVSLALALLSAPATAHDWTRERLAPVPRSGTAVVYDEARGRVVMVGGELTRDTWELDGASGWIPGPSLPASAGTIRDHAAAYDAVRNRVVVFGGVDASYALLDATWEYDGSTWVKVSPAAAPSARSGHAMAFDAVRGVTVLFGGQYSSYGYFGDTWEYDGSWRPGSPTPVGMSERAGHGLAYDGGRGVLVLFGGRRSIAFDDTWEHDGTTWRAGPAAPPELEAQSGHAMTYDAARAAVVLYGKGPEAWRYDGVAWTPDAPAPRALGSVSGGRFAYDAQRARAVFCGGDRETVWELDAAGWQLAADVISPRYDHAMAYDAARATIVLFGGATSSYGDVLADTWELGTAGWRRGPAAPPTLTPRMGHAMAYDGARGRTVLVGGYDGTLRQDAWDYDGAAWAPAGAAGGPSPRWQHAMAFDAGRQRVVLVGGWDGSYRADTWDLDGTGWSAGPPPAAGMSGRSHHALGYDPVRARVVLYGGFSGAWRGDAWELAGGAWTGATASPSAIVHPSIAFDPEASLLVVAGANDTMGHDGSWRGLGGAIGRVSTALAADAAGRRIVTFGGGDGSVDGSADTLSLRGGRAVVAGAGAGPGIANRVSVVDLPGVVTSSWLAYAASSYGANVDAAELDAAAPREILTGPGGGPLLGPHVRAFLPDGTAIAKVSFYAYGTLRYGINARGADVDADAFHEIVVGPGPGDVFGPHVRAFDYDATAVAPVGKINFFAYGTLRFGVNVGAGDLEADGFAEILTGPGPGPTFAPIVRGWDYDGIAVTPYSGVTFQAFGRAEYGARVAGGDVGADGDAEIAVANGPGPTFEAHFAGFDLVGGAVGGLPGFDVQNYSYDYGGQVALADVVGSRGPSELVTAAGPDPDAVGGVTLYAYEDGDLAKRSELPAMGTRYGASVGGGELGE